MCIAGIGLFDLFGSCNLDLDPMTFIYELNPYPLETYQMCKNEHPTSRLSKAIVLRQRMGAFSYAWSRPVMWRRWRSHHAICRSWKPHGTREPDGSMFYRTGVMGYQSYTLWEIGNRHFWCFQLLWPWPWPCDLHIQTWPILPGAIPDVQIWTSYVEAFESYRLTERQTYMQTDKQAELTEIIKHATLPVLKNTKMASTMRW